MVIGLVALGGTACSSSLARENDAALARVEADLVPIVAIEETAHEPAEPSPLDGSLERYVAHAFANNPSLRASFEDWRAATERGAQPRRLPDPTLTYTFFIRHVETRVGPQRHKLALTQWFPWPTQLTAAGDAADLAAKAEQRKFESRALELASRVATVYWKLWLIERAAEVKAEERAILEAFGAQVQARMEVGAADLAHLSQVHLAITRISDAIAGLEEKRRAAEADMRELIGAGSDAKIPVADPPPPMSLPANETALREAATRHPDVDAMSLTAESHTQRARSERGKRFPGFGLGAAWIETGPALDPMLADSGKDPVMVSASLKIPLWQRSIGAAEREAKARAAAFRARTVAERQRAVADVDRTLARLRDAERRARLFDTTLVPQAETNYQAVIGSYQAGRSSLAAVLIAERDLVELRHDLHRAQAEFGTQWAELERVVGGVVATEGDR